MSHFQPGRSRALSSGLLAVVTFISFSIIALSTLLEFIDYRRIHLEPAIMVDRTRGEKMIVDIDITFPRVPCYCAYSAIVTE